MVNVGAVQESHALSLLLSLCMVSTFHVDFQGITGQDGSYLADLLIEKVCDMCLLAYTASKSCKLLARARLVWSHTVGPLLSSHRAISCMA